MAMGRPVITTDLPGCRDTVVDGRNGFLIPGRDVEALVATMLRFIREPALIERMGKVSRAIAEERFDARRADHLVWQALFGDSAGRALQSGPAAASQTG
jgi:glycosyltransferase involved in cell wall biosynthesis